jgi:hypothetical protein
MGRTLRDFKKQPFRSSMPTRVAPWHSVFLGLLCSGGPEKNWCRLHYPEAQFWRELTAYYPRAKVLHTLHDPDEWFDSTQATLFAPGGRARQPGPRSEFFQIVLGTFGDHIQDHAYMTDYLRKHTQDVINAIPAERLLCIMRAKAGSPYANSSRCRGRLSVSRCKIRAPNPFAACEPVSLARRPSRYRGGGRSLRRKRVQPPASRRSG